MSFLMFSPLPLRPNWMRNSIVEVACACSFSELGRFRFLSLGSKDLFVVTGSYAFGCHCGGEVGLEGVEGARPRLILITIEELTFIM
jgi:hypothetical protein